jgi:hypothetical protein
MENDFVFFSRDFFTSTWQIVVVFAKFYCHVMVHICEDFVIIQESKTFNQILNIDHWQQHFWVLITSMNIGTSFGVCKTLNKKGPFKVVKIQEHRQLCC